ncbi:MAG: hypothetical protein NVS2B16_17900 [Chloroflexota bacterium]
MPVSASTVEDFLRRAVSDIWDQKMIGRITDYFSPNVTVHLPGNKTRYGTDGLMNDVTTWFSAFPDGQIFVDSTIWDTDGQDYRTSLRATFVGRNTGPSVYGSPTGRRIVISTIVNSRIRDDRFIEQWVEYDEVDLIEQLGFDVQTVLQDRQEEGHTSAFADDLGRGGVSAWGGNTAAPHILDEEKALNGVDLVHAAVDAIWNGRIVGAVPQFYAGRYRAWINARQIFGIQDLQMQVLELLAALPDLRVHIDDVICQVKRDGQHTSARWTLLGMNTGPSKYARPSNQSVRLTGITNHRVVDSRFQLGWTEYNELSLLQQLAPKNESMPEIEFDG